jgi:hypothetical protein
MGCLHEGNWCFRLGYNWQLVIGGSVLPFIIIRCSSFVKVSMSSRSGSMGLFGFSPRLALPMHRHPKYWRSFWPPTPYQFVGVKMIWVDEGTIGKPNCWIQSKRNRSSWSTPIIWLGCLGLSSGSHPNKPYIYLFVCFYIQVASNQEDEPYWRRSQSRSALAPSSLSPRSASPRPPLPRPASPHPSGLLLQVLNSSYPLVPLLILKAWISSWC